MYLPATFIYKDLRHCRFKDSILNKYSFAPDFQQAFLHPSGNYVMKYASGQAILMAPWFFIGHTIATHSTIYPADGFSYPYQKSIGLGMLLYAFIGLFVLRKVLLRYFSDSTVAIAMIALVFGSNYLNYSAIDQAMTHSPLFMIYACLLWVTIQFYEQPGAGLALLLGGITGIATLVRPTEIISIIIPVCWGISSVKDLRERFRFFLKNPGFILGFALCFTLLVSIQLIYWKSVSGHWLVYSYQNESFSWLHPHLRAYMFNSRSGWLRYSPMLILAFMGIFPFIRQRRNLLAVLLFSLINLYIVTSWDGWWYGGRAMVQSYPILFFLIAALIESVNRKYARKAIFYPAFLLFIYLNIWWTYNAHAGQVQVSETSRAYYLATVGRWSVTDNITKLLDDPDQYKGNPKSGRLLYANDFEQEAPANVSHDIVLEQEHPIYIYSIPRPSAAAKWLRASADFTVYNKEWEASSMPQFIMTVLNHGKAVKISTLRVNRLLTDGEKKNIYMDMELPDVPFDQLTVAFSSKHSDRKTVIDNLRVIELE
jgi:hypothetical protein